MSQTHTPWPISKVANPPTAALPGTSSGQSQLRMASEWGHVRLDALGASPIVSILTSSDVAAGCLWEVRPFHYHLSKAGLSRWLHGHGSHGSGSEWVDRVASALCPGVHCKWWPSQKQATAAATDTQASAKKRRLSCIMDCPVGSEHMATAGWILSYMLHWSCKPTSRDQAYMLLQKVIQAVCHSKVETACHGASLLIQDGCLLHDGGTGTLHHVIDDIRSSTRLKATITTALLKDLDSTPTVAAFMWVSAQLLGRQPDEAEHDKTRQTLRELSNVIMMALVSQMDAVALASVANSIPTATLLQSHLRGRARPRRVAPILKQRLAQKRRPHRAVAGWKDDGSHIVLSPEATMATACTRYLHKVQQTMAGTPTLEVLMDASRFGGTDNEIFVIWSPEKGVAAYAPPQVSPQFRKTSRGRFSRSLRGPLPEAYGGRSSGH